jgi:hypothetical protein
VRYLITFAVLAALGVAGYWYLAPRPTPNEPGVASTSPAPAPAPRVETATTESTGQTKTRVQPKSPATEESVAAVQPPSGTPQAPPSEALPTFDIVRIAQDGNAVIAGRAEPGAEVTVLDDGEPIGTARADPRGEWVLIPDIPIAPGSRQLTLEAEKPGEQILRSEETVVLAVPDREVAAPPQRTIAVLIPKEPGRPTRILQEPGGPVARSEGGPGVSIDSLDYNEVGKIIIAGRADPNIEVRAYSDNKLVGVVRSDDSGAWQLVPETEIAPGTHQLRLDTVEQSGKVLARVALPFQRADPSTIVLAEGQVIVQPGNSLWRIARATYGAGIRYTVIFTANRDRIGDPDLIFPGQIFRLPADTN